jgi:hypothetical protein
MLEEIQSLTEMQRYAMHLRFKLALYRIDGIEPPERLINELWLAAFFFAERINSIMSK